MIILISTIFPVLSLYITILLLIKNREKNFKIVNPFTIPFVNGMFFGILGFSMRYKHTDNDLTKYFNQISNMSHLKFYQIVKPNEFLIFRDLLFYYISRTDKYLLAFITGFTVYFIFSYIIVDYIKEYDSNLRCGEVLGFIIISISIIPIFNIIVNVRNVISFAFVTLAIYRDIYKKNRNIFTILFYAIAIGIHISALIPIVVRLICKFVTKFRTVAVIIGIFLTNIIDSLYRHHIFLANGIISGLFNNLINKAYYYINWNDGGWATEIENSLSNKINRITGLVLLIFIVVLTQIIIKKQNKKDVDTRISNSFNLLNFVFMNSVIALGCLQIKTGAFWRFELISIFFLPILLTLIKENYKEIYNILYTSLLTFGAIMMSLNVVMLVRNIDAYETMIGLLTKNGFEILYFILKGFIALF